MAADFSWTPPLVVLALGAVAGAAVVATRSRSSSGKRAKGTPETPSQASDLQRRYDALIRQLAEGASDAERTAVELEAAQVLREMEGGASAKASGSDKAAPDRPTTAIAGPARPASPFAGFAYGVLTTAVLGGLVFLASQGSSTRPEGGSPTGGNTMGSAAAGGNSATSDGEIAALEDAIRKNPTSIPQRIDLTRAYLERRDLMKVFEQTQAVLEIEPGNTHALTYQALVRVAMGQADQAEAMLLDVLKKDPMIEDAYIHLALARMQQGNREGAGEAIRDAQQRFPEDAAQLADVLTQITTAVDSQGESPAPPAQTSGERPVTTAGAASRSTGMVVVVDLPKGVVVPSSALLFVIVREAGFETGAPIAVKRVPATGFPITVTISDRDSMAGESLPGLVRLDARVDSDGDPLTKDPSDPVGSEDNVRPGGDQILMVLTPGKR